MEGYFVLTLWLNSLRAAVADVAPSAAALHVVVEPRLILLRQVVGFLGQCGVVAEWVDRAWNGLISLAAQQELTVGRGRIGGLQLLLVVDRVRVDDLTNRDDRASQEGPQPNIHLHLHFFSNILSEVYEQRCGKGEFVRDCSGGVKIGSCEANRSDE